MPGPPFRAYARAVRHKPGFWFGLVLAVAFPKGDGSPRRLVGRGTGLGGWVFDVVIGVFLADLAIGLPLSLVFSLVGDPDHLLTAASLVGAFFGVRFMRRARAAAGPVWFQEDASLGSS